MFLWGCVLLFVSTNQDPKTEVASNVALSPETALTTFTQSSEKESLDSAPPIISAQERQNLRENPDNLSPAALNGKVLRRLSSVVTWHGSEGAKAKNTIRVAVWNAERGKQWNVFCDWFGGHKRMMYTDVMLLNEMDMGMARSGNTDTTKQMAQKLTMNAVFGVEFLELTKGLSSEAAQLEGQENTLGLHGNSVLTRFAVSGTYLLRFDRPIDDWYYGNFAREPGSERRLGGRMALFTKVSIGGSDLHLISAHLECHEKDHTLEATEICNHLQMINAKHAVLGGDLCNDPNFFQTLRQKCGFLRREASNMMGSDGFTYPTANCRNGQSDANARGDWVLVKGVRVVPGSLRTYIPNSKDNCLSDHALIAVDISLT